MRAVLKNLAFAVYFVWLVFFACLFGLWLADNVLPWQASALSGVFIGLVLAWLTWPEVRRTIEINPRGHLLAMLGLIGLIVLVMSALWLFEVR